jgi:hypothetical protein
VVQLVRVMGALYETGPFTDGAIPLPGLQATQAGDLDAVIDALASTAEPTVVIYPTWRAEPFRRRLETVRTALDRATVVPHASSLPPLAGAVLVSVAAAIGAHVTSAALLASALPAIERELVPLAWCKSVARLKDPEPRLLDRIRSSLPGPGFVVRAGAEPVIVPAGARRLPVEEIYPHACVAVAERGPEAGRWLGPALAELFESAPVVPVPPAKDSPHWWGTAGLVEAVAYPTDIAALAEELLAGAVPCPWCAEPTLARPCPACGHDFNRGLAAAPTDLEEAAA